MPRKEGVAQLATTKMEDGVMGLGSGHRGWRATLEGCRTAKLGTNAITREVLGKLGSMPRALGG